MNLNILLMKVKLLKFILMILRYSLIYYFYSETKGDLENLVYQLFDFILELKEKVRYRSIIKKAIDDLCYYAILYMQITDDRIENWTCNPEQFIQDEDEESYSYSVRISGQELIETIAADFKKETGN